MKCIWTIWITRNREKKVHFAQKCTKRFQYTSNLYIILLYFRTKRKQHKNKSANNERCKENICVLCLLCLCVFWCAQSAKNKLSNVFVCFTQFLVLHHTVNASHNVHKHPSWFPWTLCGQNAYVSYALLKIPPNNS